MLQPDSYEFAEPKDIIPELKKDFWDGLASAKWSERKVGVGRRQGTPAAG